VAKKICKNIILISCSPFASSSEFLTMICNLFFFSLSLNLQALNIENQHVVNDKIKNIANGPSRDVRTWEMYYVNGFNFHTVHHSSGRSSTNTDVCVVGEEGDYYGRLIDVIELNVTLIVT
jgi:hypothetical protein